MATAKAVLNPSTVLNHYYYYLLYEHTGKSNYWILGFRSCFVQSILEADGTTFWVCI